jgi:hypothetical protein
MIVRWSLPTGKRHRGWQKSRKAKVHLPDGEFYSLHALAKRWSVHVDEILEWCRLGYLVPAIAHDGMEVEIYEGPMPIPEPDGNWAVDGHTSLGKLVEEPGILYLPLFPHHLTGVVAETVMLDVSRVTFRERRAVLRSGC